MNTTHLAHALIEAVRAARSTLATRAAVVHLHGVPDSYPHDRAILAALDALEAAEAADAEEAARQRADAATARAQRIERRAANEALRAEHRPALVKRFNAAAKHLKHNASRLHRVAYKVTPSGCSLVGCSWSTTMHTLVDACLGLDWRNETTAQAHPPNEETAAHIIALIAAQEGTASDG